jgi:hypothetical protein
MRRPRQLCRSTTVDARTAAVNACRSAADWAAQAVQEAQEAPAAQAGQEARELPAARAAQAAEEHLRVRQCLRRRSEFPELWALRKLRPERQRLHLG